MTQKSESHIIGFPEKLLKPCMRIKAYLLANFRTGTQSLCSAAKSRKSPSDALSFFRLEF
jgi:hypothetical protein